MNCFKIKVGDFLFVKNKYQKLSLEYDFQNVYHLIKDESIHFDRSFRNGERNSLDSSRPNVWDTPPGEKWKQVSDLMFPTHTEETYNLNIRMLYYISKHGWDSFVKKFKKLKIVNENGWITAF